MATSPRAPRPPGRPRIPDEKIDDAVRTVLMSAPTASMQEIAAAAGVGKSALYLRYGSRTEMLQRIAKWATIEYAAALHGALAAATANEPATEVLLELSVRIVDSGIHSLLMAISGTFPISEPDRIESNRLSRLGRELVDRFHQAAAVRPGLTWYDLVKSYEAINAIHGATPARTRQIRRRITEAIIIGFTAPTATMTGAEPAPRDFGQPPRHLRPPGPATKRKT